MTKIKSLNVTKYLMYYASEKKKHFYVNAYQNELSIPKNSMVSIKHS